MEGGGSTNEDKLRAVMTLLQDPEWTTYPEREIARIAHVSHTFVQRVRVEHLATLPDKPDTREVTRNGTTYTQNTANIGRPAIPQVPKPAFSATISRVFLPRLSSAKFCT